MANGITTNGIITNGSSGCYQSSWSLPNLYCAIYGRTSSKRYLPSGGTYVGVREYEMNERWQWLKNQAGGAEIGVYDHCFWRIS